MVCIVIALIMVMFMLILDFCELLFWYTHDHKTVAISVTLSEFHVVFMLCG